MYLKTEIKWASYLKILAYIFYFLTKLIKNSADFIFFQEIPLQKKRKYFLLKEKYLSEKENNIGMP